MTELRGLAQKADEFEKLGVRVVGISVDEQKDAHSVWESAGGKKITILSDEGASVIRKYGLLHALGAEGKDIALRTTLLVGPDGLERWRRVSDSVPDIPTIDETLNKVRQSQEAERGVDKNH
jgi:peroxiredoxin